MLDLQPRVGIHAEMNRFIGKRPRRWTSTESVISAVLVIVVFFSGFINLVHIGTFYLATVLVDGLTLIMILWMVVGGSLASVRVESWLVSLLLVTVSMAVLFLNGQESASLKFLTIRSEILYASAGVFIVSTVSSRSGALHLISLIRWLGLIFAVFGIIQFLLRSSLPRWLLYTSDTQLFGYYGTDLTRSTGLLGNTIVYSAVLLLVLSLWTFHAVFRTSALSIVPLIVLVCAIFTTFSRIAIACAVLLIIFAGVYWLRKRGAPGLITLIGGFLVGGLFIIAFPLSIQSLSDSFLVSNLFGGLNPSVRASTDLHTSQVSEALSLFREHPILGLGLGTQDESSIHALTSVVITDGAIWAVLVEGGLILLVPFFILFLSMLTRVIGAMRSEDEEVKSIALALCFYLLLQVGVASWLNSAIFGKVPFILTWVVFGCLVTVSRKRKDTESDPMFGEKSSHSAT